MKGEGHKILLLVVLLHFFAHPKPPEKWSIL